MRKDLSCCLPVIRTTGATESLFRKFWKMRNFTGMFLLMIFSFSTNAFAQPAKIDLDQARNGGHPGGSTFITVVSPIDWVNGNLGSSNSHYREGYSVPYRARLTNIPLGDSITVVFGFDIKHSDKNALDYLTYYRRNQSHTGWNPEHNEEVVNPLASAVGSYGAPAYKAIPCPTVAAVYTPPTPTVPQPNTSCTNLPNVSDPPGLPAGRQHEMTIWNGKIGHIFYVPNADGFPEGDLDAAQSEARIAVTFWPEANNIVIAWGGHIGSRVDWGFEADGTPRSAGGISGSPYHMRIVSWGINRTGDQDGSLPNLGNTDRSLSADAVAAPPNCTQKAFTTNATNPLCPNSSNTYGVTILPGVGVCTTPAFQWSIPAATNTSGATITSLTTINPITVNSGTTCGSFLLRVQIICSEGVLTCDTTINVVDVSPPVITITGYNGTLGCNPTEAQINAAFGTASATDNCAQSPTVTSSDGSVSGGCTKTKTRTWTATDGCGNTSSTSRTVSWTDDTQPPTITVTGHNGNNLGCNPTGAQIEAAFGTATASDNCTQNPTLTSSTGGVTGGCTKSQTRTWTATDGCGNTSSTSRTVTWTDDTQPPTITITGYTPTLGCNPTAAQIDGAFGTAGATDNCTQSPTVTSSDGGVTGGCTKSKTRTWTATDGCGNTSSTSRTVTWTDDTQPPTISVTGHNGNNLGCNPTGAQIEAAFGTATASDNCTENPTLTSSTGAASGTCTRTQTRTWTATDGCGNTSSTSRTVTWTADTQAPTITITGHTPTLGCNPTAAQIEGAFGTLGATDNCTQSPTVTSSDGSVTGGCTKSKTRTWTATDGCGNTSSTSRTVSWTDDTQPPTISVTGHNGNNLGCNPTGAQIEAAFGTATASDNCTENPTLTSSTGAASGTCTRTQTRTWTATDGCGNTSSTSRTVTWTADTQPPTITITGHTPTLGCNPTAAQIEGAFGTVGAVDNCTQNPTVTSSDGSVSGGCTKTKTRTWTATDGCGNTSSTSRTVTWTDDTQPPTISVTGHNGSLGCNPTGAQIEAAFGTATASDNCTQNPTLTSSTGAASGTCTRTQTRTWTATDGCGNTSSTSRTVTWTADTESPVFTNTPASVDIECNLPIPDPVTPTATDNCTQSPTVTMTGSTDNTADCSTGFSRIITRTWTATDACGNTATVTQTIRVRCCSDHLFPTETTCCTFSNGTSQALTRLCYSTSGTSVSNATPGVMFYYATVVAPSSNFTVNVVQTKSLGTFNFLDVHQGQIRIWTANCGDFVQGTETSAGQGSVTLTGATAGATYIISVKYNVKSMIGSTFTNPPPTVTYNFIAYVKDNVANTAPVVIPNSGGSIDAVANCTSEFVDPGTCGTSFTAAARTSELNVSAHPNPYLDQNFSLRINAPVSGQATIEFFTIDGRKISELKRNVVAHRDEVVNYRVPGSAQTKIIYTVRVGKYNSKGIVLNPN